MTESNFVSDLCNYPAPEAMYNELRLCIRKKNHQGLHSLKEEDIGK